ncbi:MAG: UDP-glucose/GDP-mannose dehydrogenase family protein [Rickettsiaceae bacterium]|nr:MAG: UDP-glucose/GDP-mannose dehydrogenase family protein [Rickettsiaceae bacterium]
MNITFIGVGYVGLVSGVMMSSFGYNVTCLDTDKIKIEQLKQGILPIFEPGLKDYLARGISNKNLEFTSQYDDNLRKSSVIFITVWTPSSKDHGEADLQYVFEAINQLSPYINSSCIIVIKSTVPPGTCQKVEAVLTKMGLNNQVLSNPEFLKEGSAIIDFLSPDRIVIGAKCSNSFEILANIYQPLTSKGITIVNTDPITSELIKYAANTFLATKIAFINELANLCSKVGADIRELTFAMGLDQRIGKDFLKPGPGFGGSCFPKDILALSSIANDNHTKLTVLDAVIEANKNRPAYLVAEIKKVIGDLKDKTISVLGLTYKANTDDVRSSPAIAIIKLLQAQQSYIKAFDPIGNHNAALSLSEVNITNSAVEACHLADAIIITTEWEHFKDLDFNLIFSKVKSPLIFDFRNLLDAKLLREIGFIYHSIG